MGWAGSSRTASTAAISSSACDDDSTTCTSPIAPFGWIVISRVTMPLTPLRLAAVGYRSEPWMRSLRRPSHGPYSAPASPPPPPGVARATCWPTGLVAAPVGAPSAPAVVPPFAVVRLGSTVPRESADEPSPATGGGGVVGAWDTVGGAGAAVDGLGQVTGGNASCACAGIGVSGAGTTGADAGGGAGGGVDAISPRAACGSEVPIFSMGAGAVGATFFGAARGG